MRVPPPNSPSAPSRPRRLAAVLASLALTAVAIELAAYLGHERLTGVPFDAPLVPGTESTEAPDVRAGREQAGLGMRDAAMSLHPYLGYVYTPPEPGAPSGPVAISPDGFLDTGPAVRRRNPDRLLVGLTGGSVAGQLGTWHAPLLERAILESRLEWNGAPVRAVEFVRLGMPGYHQPQQVQQLTWILAQGGELDVLVNLDGFNEVAVPAALNAPRGTGPLFPMNWSMVALDVPDLAVRRDIGAIDWLREERGRRAAAFASSWRAHSPLLRLLWRREDRRLAEDVAARTWRLAQFRVDEIPWFVRGPERLREVPGGLVPFCVEVWKRCSLQMQALCETSGIRYVHVLQPNQYDPGAKPLSEQESAVAYEPDSPYRAVVEEGYPLLRAAGAELRAAGVAFVDLSGLFADVEEPLYVDNCCHLNAAGNELLSAAIADALRM